MFIFLLLCECCQSLFWTFLVTSWMRSLELRFTSRLLFRNANFKFQLRSQCSLDNIFILYDSAYFNLTTIEIGSD